MATKKSDHNLLVSALSKIDKSAGEIKEEIGEIRKDVAALSNISAKQQGILETHIRRTELAEEAIKSAAAVSAADRDALIQRLVPLEEHVSMWAGAGKVLVILAAASAIAVAVYKILSASFAL